MHETTDNICILTELIHFVCKRWLKSKQSKENVKIIPQVHQSFYIWQKQLCSQYSYRLRRMVFMQIFIHGFPPKSCNRILLLSVTFHRFVLNNILKNGMFLHLTLTRNLDSIYHLPQSSILLKDKLVLPKTKINPSSTPSKIDPSRHSLKPTVANEVSYFL